MVMARQMVKAHIGGTHGLALAHRQAEMQLVEIFADNNQRQIFFHRAESPARLHGFGIKYHLLQGFDISGGPSAAMRAKLCSPVR